MKYSIVRTLDKLDYVLISIVILLIIIGLFSIYSAAGQYDEDPTHYLTRQAVWFVVGLVAIVFILALEYEHYRTLAIPLYVLGVLALLYVHFIVVMEVVSHRWINIAWIIFPPLEF